MQRPSRAASTPGLPRDATTLTTAHARLRGAPDVETGSALLLDWARGWLRGDTELVLARGAVHFRSREGGYRAVHQSEWLAEEVSPLSPSASVWSRVAQSDASVWLDLGTCRGVVLGTGEAFETAPAQVPFERTSSVLQMIERHSTHVLASPLRGPGRIEGMLTLEVADHVGVLERLDLAPRAMEVGDRKSVV
jgi:hypothetical protein